MTLTDLFRFAVIAMSGSAIGVMLVVTWLAWGVLRPARPLGFLAWHILAITASIVPLVVVAADATIARLHQPVTWRLPTLLFSLVVLNVAMWIVYQIEWQRLVDKKAREKVSSREF